VGVSLRPSTSFSSQVHGFDIFHHFTFGWKLDPSRQNTSNPFALEFTQWKRDNLNEIEAAEL
jgi:hypothetical protein